MSISWSIYPLCTNPTCCDLLLRQGFTANLVRNSVISATEIVTYDVTKQALLHRAGMEEGLPAHLAAAMTAGERTAAAGRLMFGLQEGLQPTHDRYRGLPVT